MPTTEELAGMLNADSLVNVTTRTVEAVSKMQARIAELEAEELREDKERLDWWDNNAIDHYVSRSGTDVVVSLGRRSEASKIRDAIDGAKGATHDPTRVNVQTYKQHQDTPDWTDKAREGEK